ncbi:MAG: hypothetical protein WA144_14145 [Candidatus Methanoperedens sp.]
MFGVGTELITGRPAPALDGIYKLSDVVEHRKHVPKMKLSEEIVKTTLPGKKTVWRIMENGKFKKDIITLENEIVDEGVPLLETVVWKGKISCDMPSLPEIRQNAALNISKLPDIYKKLEGC